MKAKRVWIPMVVLTASLAAGAANAHPGHGKHYDERARYGSHWKAPKRSKRMPDWLYYKPHFRRWYHRSAVKYKRHLAWWQVYRIYQRQVASHYYGYPRHRDRDYHGYYHDRREYRDDRRRGGKRYKDRDDRPHRRGS